MSDDANPYVKLHTVIVTMEEMNNTSLLPLISECKNILADIKNLQLDAANSPNYVAKKMLAKNPFRE